MRSTRVWVTTIRAAKAKGSGSARASGSTTREMRVTPLKTTASVATASRPAGLAASIPSFTITSRNAA